MSLPGFRNYQISTLAFMGGAMVLSKLSVPRRSTDLANRRARA